MNKTNWSQSFLSNYNHNKRHKNQRKSFQPPLILLLSCTTTPSAQSSCVSELRLDVCGCSSCS